MLLIVSAESPTTTELVIPFNMLNFYSKFKNTFLVDMTKLFGFLFPLEVMLMRK